jgi:hypothetical protein
LGRTLAFAGMGARVRVNDVVGWILRADIWSR